MSDVHVYDLDPKNFNAYREVAKGYPTERHAGRAVFVAGLKLLSKPGPKRAPAPSPVDATTAATPVVPEAPPVTLESEAAPAPAPAKKKAAPKKAPARRSRS